MTGSPRTRAPNEAPAAADGRSLLASGNWRQRLRLWSGLILFAFCLSHFLNHATGIISVNAMEAYSSWHYLVWHTAPGEQVLLGAILIHMGLALWRTARRRTLRMPRWEFLQLVLGLYIPWTLIPHATTTLGLAEKTGFAPTYHQMLTILWPDKAFSQSVLLVVVWVHAMIGLHFWLRLHPLYRRFRIAAVAFAIAVPVLALWGWIEGARRLALSETVTLKIGEPDIAWVYETTDEIRAVVFGLILVSLLAILVRYLSARFARRLTVRYPGELAVRALPGSSLLEVSRMNGIPHASVCGGRARCSTCRVRIVGGYDNLPPPTTSEKTVLNRIGAESNVRLACQTRPTADVEVMPLVPVKVADAGLARLQDAYYWGVEEDVVIMFVDLRGFTAMTESQLAYDVVFLLNQYLDRVSSAIKAEGGYVDKFIGDGVMAIFGMGSDSKTGARQALAAAKRIAKSMDALNRDRGPQFKEPLRIGIGLHGGSAILGRIGSAGIASGGGNLTALGDVVNTASRLEGENKAHGSILAVSKAVLDSAGAIIDAYEPSEIRLRGKEIPLEIYMVTDLDRLTVPDSLAAADHDAARKTA